MSDNDQVRPPSVVTTSRGGCGGAMTRAGTAAAACAAHSHTACAAHYHTARAACSHTACAAGAVVDAWDLGVMQLRFFLKGDVHGIVVVDGDGGRVGVLSAAIYVIGYPCPARAHFVRPHDVITLLIAALVVGDVKPPGGVKGPFS